MQNSVNHRDFERTWHFQVSLGSMFLRVEFPPHLGGAPPAGARPEAASGAHSVARHWLKLGSAGRALRALARRFRPGWRSGGVASRWARAVPIGVLVASPRERRRSLMCAARPRAGLDPQAMPLASARPPPSRAHRAAARAPCALRLNLLHRMEQDYPLNLSISLSGGKETNRDAPSNGE